MDYRIEQLRYRLREDPSSRLFFQLGESLRREGDFDEAVEVLERGLEIHPRYVAAWVALGRTLRDRGDADGAQQACAQALELDPENQVAARLIGEIAADRGDWVRAVKALKLARALGPRDPDLEEQIAEVEARLEDRGLLERRPGPEPPAPAPAPEPPSTDPPSGNDARLVALSDDDPFGIEDESPTEAVGASAAAQEDDPFALGPELGTQGEDVPDPSTAGGEAEMPPDESGDDLADEPFGTTLEHDEPQPPPSGPFAAEDLPAAETPDRRFGYTEADVQHEVATAADADEGMAEAEPTAPAETSAREEDDSAPADEEPDVPRVGPEGTAKETAAAEPDLDPQAPDADREPAGAPAAFDEVEDEPATADSGPLVAAQDDPPAAEPETPFPEVTEPEPARPPHEPIEPEEPEDESELYARTISLPSRDDGAIDPSQLPPALRDVSAWQPPVEPPGPEPDDDEPEEEAEDVPVPTLTLARLAMAQEDWQLAERTLQSLLESDPGLDEARAMLVEVRARHSGVSSASGEQPAPRRDPTATIGALRRWLEAIKLASERHSL